MPTSVFPSPFQSPITGISPVCTISANTVRKPVSIAVPEIERTITKDPNSIYCRFRPSLPITGTSPAMFHMQSPGQEDRLYCCFSGRTRHFGTHQSCHCHFRPSHQQRVHHPLHHMQRLKSGKPFVLLFLEIEHTISEHTNGVTAISSPSHQQPEHHRLHHKQRSGQEHHSYCCFSR